MKLYNELAEYYFSIEDCHRDINEDITLIRSLLHNKSQPRLLDLGCGSGEHLDRLSKFGIDCIGLDSSEAMINVAKKRFQHSVSFFLEDMTRFDFYNEYDIIISLFGSFNYLIHDADVDKVLWNTWRAMRPEGIGLFEIWNSIPVEKIKEKSLGHVSSAKYHGTLIDRERGFRTLPSTNKTIVEVNYKYTLHQKGKEITINDKHIMRTFSTDEISRFCKDNGFVVRKIYSNFLKESYQDLSNRMIIHFEKA